MEILFGVGKEITEKKKYPSFFKFTKDHPSWII